MKSVVKSQFGIFLLAVVCSTGVLANTPVSKQMPRLSAIGTYEVTEEDFVYAKPDGVELKARSYRPNKDGMLPAAVEVHGGAWNLYDRTAGEYYNRALASAGLYVLAVDFRQGPDHQHPLGSRDAAAAVRFLRSNARRLGVDQSSIGLIGSSSGGHLALLAGLKPEAAMHKQATGQAQVSATVNYIVALWPVSDPHYRYLYAKELGRERLLAMHDAYFGNESAMREASIPRILRDGEAVVDVPPVLVVQPGDDANIPRSMTFDLIAAYQEKHGAVDYVFYPGQPHAFGHRPSAASESLLQVMRDFIDRQLAAAQTER